MRETISTCYYLVTVLCPTLLCPTYVQLHRIVALQAFLFMWFTSRNTGVGCHALPQRVFLTQGSNLHLETVRYHRYFRRNLKEHTLLGNRESWQWIYDNQSISIGQYSTTLYQRELLHLYEMELLSLLSGLYNLKSFKWLKSNEKWGVIKGKLYRILLLLFSWSVISNSCQPHGLQHTRLSCPSSFPRACSNSSPLSQWCHPIISSSLVPFSSYLQSFPASGCFPMSQFFTSGGQSIRVSASASVLPMNILVL